MITQQIYKLFFRCELIHLCLIAFLVDFISDYPLLYYYTVICILFDFKLKIKQNQSRNNTEIRYRSRYKKQWVTSQPPIAHFNLNLNYEKFICLFTLQK